MSSGRYSTWVMSMSIGSHLAYVIEPVQEKGSSGISGNRNGRVDRSKGSQVLFHLGRPAIFLLKSSKVDQVSNRGYRSMTLQIYTKKDHSRLPRQAYPSPIPYSTPARKRGQRLSASMRPHVPMAKSSSTRPCLGLDLKAFVLQPGRRPRSS